MAAEKRLVQCDECQQWYPMTEDHIFSSTVLFEFPDYWFRVFGGKLGYYRTEMELCSWLCTKNYVDRMYAMHQAEDPR